MKIDLIKDYGFEEKGWFNNRCFFKKGSLLIVEHNGDFYWDKSDDECICYDYPIESTEELKKLVELYEKFDFCKQNPKTVTLFDYRQCVEEIKTLRRIWNK